VQWVFVRIPYARRSTGGWSSRRLVENFPVRIGAGQVWTEENSFHWRDRVAVRDQFARKTLNLWMNSSAVMKVFCTSAQIRTTLTDRQTFYGRLFGALRSPIFGWKHASALQGLSSFARWSDGATLFFKVVSNKVSNKVVSNKLRFNVENKITLICAKFWCRSDQYLTKVSLQAVKQLASLLACPVAVPR